MPGSATLLGSLKKLSVFQVCHLKLQMTGLSEAVRRASQLEQEMRANSLEVARLRNQFMSLYSQNQTSLRLGDIKGTRLLLNRPVLDVGLFSD
jgi:hypothetical protein